jgi:predicted acylesterase/phospholipase RssA
MPDMFSVLTQAMHITEYKIVSSRLKEADLVITPDTQGIDVLDFMKAREAIQKGENAACEALRDTDIF